MKAACCDCSLRSMVAVHGNSATVECKGHPPQRLPADRLSGHLASYRCENFAPQLLGSARPEDEWTVSLFRELAATEAGTFSQSLKRWLGGPPNDVTVSSHRGKAMLSVSEGMDQDFEHDAQFRSYSNNNHMFADLLVPLHSRLNVPIVFGFLPPMRLAEGSPELRPLRRSSSLWAVPIPSQRFASASTMRWLSRACVLRILGSAT